jgi:hypothetical protein
VAQQIKQKKYTFALDETGDVKIVEKAKKKRISKVKKAK